ncbi:MAG: PD40 domain-containing protein, partial [Planctomycetales bacterium]|nr:PD40 domain-containing protein [Planctomycetales bacterium]
MCVAIVILIVVGGRYLPRDTNATPSNTGDGVSLRTADAQASKVPALAPYRIVRSWQADSSRWDRCWRAVYSPDGSAIATATDDQSVKLWNPDTGEMLYELRGHTNGVNGINYSPDGRQLCSSDWDGNIRVWNTQTRKAEKVLSFGKTAWWVMFSHDGQRLIAGGGSGAPDRAAAMLQQQVARFEESTLELQSQLAERGEKLDLKFHQRTINERLRMRQQMLSQMKLQHAGQLQIWDTAEWKLRTNVTLESFAIREIASSPDDRFLVTCGAQGELSIRDSDTGEVTNNLAENETSLSRDEAVTVSKDGRLIAASTLEGVMIYDVALATIRHRLIVPEATRALAFTPNGRILVSGHEGTGAIRLWNVETGRLLETLSEQTSSAFDVAFSPDGRTLAIARSKPGRVVLVEVDFERLLRDASNDNSDSTTIDVVRGTKARLLHTWTPGGDSIRDVAVSPDGRWVATANDNKTASVWDIATGGMVKTLYDFDSAVLCVTFSPD